MSSSASQNILEGLGLLGSGYSIDKFAEGSIRYKKLKHLYFDNDLTQLIEIVSDKQVSLVYDRLHLNQSEPSFIYMSADYADYTRYANQHLGALEQSIAKQLFSIGKEGKFSRIGTHSGEMLKADINFIKKYDFANLTEFEGLFQEFLLPPNGSNLYSVVRRNKELWSEFAKLFAEQKLELVLYDEKQEFILQKKEGPYVWQYPFFSIADTFRRFMFYITAIESNKNSVIIFEEPEVHSFPPCTQEMAYQIVYDEDNQYFISTHSPYLLHTLIENIEYEDLNVFVTYYRDYQTHVKALTQEELRDILDFSTDAFFNLDRFTPDVPTNTPVA